MLNSKSLDPYKHIIHGIKHDVQIVFEQKDPNSQEG